MSKKGEKILTHYQVKKLGLDKVSVITADMLDGFIHIGSDAFRGCSSLISIEIPNSVTSIGGWVFNGCTGLTTVTIPNSVVSIGSCAFTGCASLASIEIPNSVISIEHYAFDSCTSLTSVVIPNSVTSIGWCVFRNCTGLISITIPNRAIHIGDDAFNGCKRVASVTIGDKTYEKQTVVDSKCKAYKAFKADMVCRNFQYEEGKTYEFKGKLMLCESGFHACLSLLDVFNYYCGEIGKDIVIHEVELEGVSNERRNDSKVVAKKITIGKRIL